MLFAEHGGHRSGGRADYLGCLSLMSCCTATLEPPGGHMVKNRETAGHSTEPRPHCPGEPSGWNKAQSAPCVAFQLNPSKFGHDAIFER